jgi:hypothetical protein
MLGNTLCVTAVWHVISLPVFLNACFGTVL